MDTIIKYFKSHLVNSNKGFTLVELLMIIGLSAVLIGFVSINLVKVQQNTNSSISVDSLNSDLKSQQVKAMNGTGSGGQSYGIYFPKAPNNNKYILFTGTTYSAASTTNLSVDLSSSAVTISTTILPTNNPPSDLSTKIVFSPRSGELSPAPGATNPTIILTNTTNGKTKTLTINKYGTIVSVN